jgi:hypothetical protein
MPNAEDAEDYRRCLESDQAQNIWTQKGIDFLEKKGWIAAHGNPSVGDAATPEAISQLETARYSFADFYPDWKGEIVAHLHSLGLIEARSTCCSWTEEESFDDLEKRKTWRSDSDNPDLQSWRLRDRKKMSVASRILMPIAVMAAFGTLITFVQSTSNLDKLEPCEHGCIFIRYFGTPELPSSEPGCWGVQGFDNCPATWADLWWRRGGPNFISIRNGQANISQATAPDIRFQPFRIVAVWGWKLSNKVRRVDVKRAPPPNINNTLCASSHLRKDIKNHLADAFSKRLFIVMLIFWAFFRILHEELLASGFVENVTMHMSMCALVSQMIATAASFMWAIGTTEVFVRVDPNGGGGCYYQMPGLAALFATVTPCLLLKQTWDDIWRAGYACLHGDHLHSISYAVPYSVAETALGDKLSVPFLPSVVKGTMERLRLMPRHVTHVNFVGFLTYLKEWGQAFITASWVVSFGAPSLFGKAMILAHEGHRDMRRSGLWVPRSPNEGVAYAALLVLILCPVYVVYKGLPRLARNIECLQTFRAYRLFWQTDSESVKKISPMYKLYRWWRVAIRILEISLLIWPFFRSIWPAIRTWQGVTNDQQDPTVEDVQIWANAGYYYLWMMAYVYASNDTPFEYLQLALRAKSNQVPDMGIVDIILAAQRYSHLGIEFEAAEAVNLLKLNNPQIKVPKSIQRHDFGTKSIFGSGRSKCTKCGWTCWNRGAHRSNGVEEIVCSSCWDEYVKIREEKRHQRGETEQTEVRQIRVWVKKRATTEQDPVIWKEYKGYKIWNFRSVLRLVAEWSRDWLCCGMALEQCELEWKGDVPYANGERILLQDIFCRPSNREWKAILDIAWKQYEMARDRSIREMDIARQSAGTGSAGSVLFFKTEVEAVLKNMERPNTKEADDSIEYIDTEDDMIRYSLETVNDKFRLVHYVNNRPLIGQKDFSGIVTRLNWIPPCYVADQSGFRSVCPRAYIHGIKALADRAGVPNDLPAGGFQSARRYT